MPKALGSSVEVTLALSRVGELLASEGQAFAIAIIGGAALLLTGAIGRSTTGVDVIAVGTQGALGLDLKRPPNPLPEPLIKASRIVARDLGLANDWLNSEAGSQWLTGLPPDWTKRIVWQQFGNLNVGVVARQDLICLKVFAATGATSAEEKHYQDLMKLKPSTDELTAAGAWAESQGIGNEFSHELETLLTNARRDLGQSQR